MRNSQHAEVLLSHAFFNYLIRLASNTRPEAPGLINAHGRHLSSTTALSADEN